MTGKSNSVEVVLDQHFYAEKLRIIAEKNALILDVGGHSPFHKMLTGAREAFEENNVQYLVMDIQPNKELQFQADAHNLPVKSSCVDTVILNSVLEHVYDPIRVVDEVTRVLRPGGKLLGYVPFLYPYHGQPDCWRFTKDALLYCLRNFESISIQPVYGYIGTTARFLTGFRWSGRSLDMVERPINKIIATLRRRPLNPINNTTGFNFFATKRDSES